jgi:NADH:ubiquinone oxidoreductase subunit K
MGDLQHAVTNLFLVPVHVVEAAVIIGLAILCVYARRVR